MLKKIGFLFMLVFWGCGEEVEDEKFNVWLGVWADASKIIEETISEVEETCDADAKTKSLVFKRYLERLGSTTQPVYTSEYNPTDEQIERYCQWSDEYISLLNKLGNALKRCGHVGVVASAD